MHLKLSEVAKRDLIGITDYYSEISTTLAGRFVDETSSALNQLYHQPNLGSPRYAHFLADQSLRVWQLDHFPFLVFYRLGGKSLEVLRVLHERRDLSADLIAR
jgi:toxin ParE1/3/4